MAYLCHLQPPGSPRTRPPPAHAAAAPPAPPAENFILDGRNDDVSFIRFNAHVNTKSTFVARLYVCHQAHFCGQIIRLSASPLSWPDFTSVIKPTSVARFYVCTIQVNSHEPLICTRNSPTLQLIARRNRIDCWETMLI